MENNKMEGFIMNYSPELEESVKNLLLDVEKLGDVTEIPGASGQFSLVRINTEKFKEFEGKVGLMFPVKDNEQFMVCTNIK